jgi:hypothetical protein
MSRKNHISEFVMASENCHQHTCFQRKRPILYLPAASRRRRDKPRSMMISNATSVTSEPIIVGSELVKSRMTQAFFSGDHVERIYGLSGKASRSKAVKFKFNNSPVLYL